MKKFWSTVAVFASAVLFFSCGSTKVDYQARAQESTPENSVVMIFMGIQSGMDYDLSQINPNFKPNWIPIDDSRYVTTPMEPGSCYIVNRLTKDLRGYERRYGGLPSLTDSLPFAYLNEKAPKHFGAGTKILVPDEPGFYIQWLFIDVQKMKDDGRIVIGKAADSVDDYKNSAIGRFYVRGRLKKAAKKYAGTAWEAVINKELEEWQ